MRRAPKSSPTPRASDPAFAVIAVQAVPGASRSEVIGPHGDAIRIRIAAPPVDGRANAALVDAIAGWLGVPKSAVEVVGGAATRSKRLRIEGIGTDVARRRLLAQVTNPD
jgi:uncharacterized protein (TIGR00251 family)